jgi:hypothetical protein
MAGGGAISLILLAAAGAQPEISFAPQAMAKGSHVVLADVADLSAIPAALRPAAAALPIAAFAQGQERLVVTRSQLAARVRALMPALAPWLSEPGDGTVVVSRIADAAVPAGAQARCVRLARRVEAGEYFGPSAYSAEPCGPARRATSYRYDARTGAVRAARVLEPGELISAPPRSLSADVEPGQTLYLETRVGPVTLQRKVVALQPSRSGQALFVKAEDGSVFSAPAPGAAP